MNKILQFNEWVSVNRPKYTTTISGETTNSSGDVIKATNETIGKIVADAIRKFGNDANLNFIDTSDVTKMNMLFYLKPCDKFNGDISEWNVSNVTDMEKMFKDSEFNGDISKWDVSNVENFDFMFQSSVFNGDISEWNVSNATGFEAMFNDSKFNGDLSKWRPNNKAMMRWMFQNSEFNGDISSWNIQYEKGDERYKDKFNDFKTLKTYDMFKKSPLEKNPPKWYIPYYSFNLGETDDIPYECVEYIVSTVKNFKERYKDNLDSIDGWGTTLKGEDPEFFNELLRTANDWLMKNKAGYTVRPHDISVVFDPNVFEE